MQHQQRPETAKHELCRRHRINLFAVFHFFLVLAKSSPFSRFKVLYSSFTNYIWNNYKRVGPRATLLLIWGYSAAWSHWNAIGFLSIWIFFKCQWFLISFSISCPILAFRYAFCFLLVSFLCCCWCFFVIGNAPFSQMNWYTTFYHQIYHGLIKQIHSINPYSYFLFF